MESALCNLIGGENIEKTSGCLGDDGIFLIIMKNLDNIYKII